MWGSVLGLGILAALNPVRLGLALLMISRPRPGPSLLAYWLGGLTVCVPELLVPLMLLNFTPVFGHLAHGSASPSTSSALGRIQITLGVVALSVAALMTVRFLTGQRKLEPAPDADRSPELSMVSGAPIAMPRLLTRVQDVPADDPSRFRRLLGRIHHAWESGASWVAWVIGVIAVPVDGVLFIVAIIAASGASITAQAGASVAFVILMYAVVEIILVGYVIRPAKTQSLLLVLHDWVRSYHRQILVALFTVVGVSELAQGLHIL
ncbi:MULTISPECIES: GAP family protein [Mycobacterium]|uniref:GAP family protein n=1 Tax=Mycobacterium colombiense TaxID=339268 RepID=A0A329LQK4_9MYCO|nr:MULTISPECIES: GAP family protein [Mycobacterium]MDM4141935.1 GAP family protein [Mycobacterium sp. FLAC0960]RAV09728.1 GAP family protein [Mycobacterium colombiense]